MMVTSVSALGTSWKTGVLIYRIDHQQLIHQLAISSYNYNNFYYKCLRIVCGSHLLDDCKGTAAWLSLIKVTIFYTSNVPVSSSSVPDLGDREYTEIYTTA